MRKASEKLALCLATGIQLALLAGCGKTTDLNTTPSKDDFKGFSKADSTWDPCEKYGWYGDGVCDDFCPLPDPDCADCLDVGEQFEDSNTQGKCCAGLTAVPDSYLRNGGCFSPPCDCFICTACGDGVCGTAENKCNCPADCASEPTCLGEGGKFETSSGTDIQEACCEGLTAVSDKTIEEGQCRDPRCPCFICLACGDGVCAGAETDCNCPADCGATSNLQPVFGTYTVKGRGGLSTNVTWQTESIYIVDDPNGPGSRNGKILVEFKDKDGNLILELGTLSSWRVDLIDEDTLANPLDQVWIDVGFDDDGIVDFIQYCHSDDGGANCSLYSTFVVDRTDDP